MFYAHGHHDSHQGTTSQSASPTWLSRVSNADPCALLWLSLWKTDCTPHQPSSHLDFATRPYRYIAASAKHHLYSISKTIIIVVQACKT